jgi:hypothetical protein
LNFYFAFSVKDWGGMRVRLQAKMTGMCWERPKFMRIREELFRVLSKGIF